MGAFLVVALAPTERLNGATLKLIVKRARLVGSWATLSMAVIENCYFTAVAMRFACARLT
jgi:hypothetical protein